MTAPEDACPRVTVSLLKRHLLEPMSEDTRLQFVGSLERWADDLGADVVAAIKPMCDRGYQIVTEALELGTANVIDVFAERFPAFAALNPSLVASRETFA
jgi:hypothetical protein